MDTIPFIALPATIATVIGCLDLLIGNATRNEGMIEEGCYLLVLAFGMWLGLLAYSLSSLYFH